MKKKSKPVPIFLRVQKGALVPAFTADEVMLRDRKYSIGDVLTAHLTKPRNPKFHRLVHAFGELLAQNLDDFEGLDAHTVIKRLQLEAGIECDEIALKVSGVGMVMHRTPRSISFASMDEAQFNKLFRKLATYVSKKYWPDMTAQQIEQMSGLMPEEQT